MTVFLKNDWKGKDRNRRSNRIAIITWIALALAGATYITVLGDWGQTGTINVFQFYMIGLALIIHTVNSIVAIWRRE